MENYFSDIFLVSLLLIIIMAKNKLCKTSGFSPIIVININLLFPHFCEKKKTSEISKIPFRETNRFLCPITRFFLFSEYYYYYYYYFFQFIQICEYRIRSDSIKLLNSYFSPFRNKVMCSHYH